MSDSSGPGWRFGLIIIGDELLSGKRQDKHFQRVIEMLDGRGLELAWARILGDEPGLLTENLRQTFAAGDVVLSCGGIGATPDDRTRQCAADALGIPLARHPDGVAELQARFGEREITDRRYRLVDFPEGAAIIPNPVNRVPGFSIRDHHFVPGFPNMAWPMIEWVLDKRYAHLHAPGTRTELAITVPGARESDVIPLMESFVERYPQLRMSCLPSTQSDGFQLELGLRGPSEAVASGMDELRRGVEALGFTWQPAVGERD